MYLDRDEGRVARAGLVGRAPFGLKLVNVVLLAAIGCLSRGFVQLDASVEIAGVAIGLLDGECRYRSASTQPEQRVSEVEITMQIRNASFGQATFDPHELSVTSGGTVLSPTSAQGIIEINPGAGRTITVRFEGPALIRCDAPMAVDLDHALHVAGRRPSDTASHSIRFRASSWRR